MLKVREGDIRLQLKSFLQFVPVIGSRELEKKAEIYLLELGLRVGVAMFTSELR
jgi:hypothetical protein